MIRWISWGFFILILLLTAFILCLRIPAVQNALTQKAITFLKDKIKTEVRLESLYVSFPKTIVLKNLYVEDQQEDTLLYAGELNIDTDLWALTQKKIELNTINLQNCIVRINRSTTDSTFNFNYIVEAFQDTLSEAVTDTTTTPWDFSVETIELTRTSLNFDDQYSGNDIQARVGALDLEIDEFDLAHMIVEVESLNMENVRLDIGQYPAGQIEANPDSSSISPLPDIQLSSLDFQQIHIRYHNALTGQHIQTDIDQLQIEAHDIQLNNKIIDLEEINLSNSFISFHQARQEKKQKQITSQPTTEFNIPWTVDIDQIELINNSIHYDDFNFAPAYQSFDNNHLHVAKLNLSAENLHIHGQTAKGNVKEFSFHEKNGFGIKSFTTSIELTERHLNISKFDLRTEKSKLIMKGHADFHSLTQIKESSVNLTLRPSVVSLSDLLFFSPTLLDSVPLTLSPSTTISLESQLSGNLKKLDIHKLNVQTFDSTILSLQGILEGLDKPETSSANIDLTRLRTTQADLESVLIDSLIPESIELPQWIEITGHSQGAIKAPAIQAQLSSNQGSLSVNGKFDFNALPTYDAELKTEQFHLGKILKQPDMGAITLQATAKGSGLSLDTINAVVDLSIADFEYNHYHYKDFKLEGKLHKYLFSGAASLHDENLDFTLKGDLDYQKEIPLYKFTLALTNINFEKLNLSERPLKARGTLDLNLNTSDFQVMNGNMAIRKVAIFNGESLYTVDSLLFVSLDQEGESNMTIQSDILSGEFNGSFNVFSIGKVMKQHINHYFSLQDSTLQDFESPQQFKFNLTLKNTDLITEILIPDLEPFVPGKIKGEFDSKLNKLNLEIQVAQLNYSTTSVDSVSVLVNSDERALHYKFRIKNVKLDTLTIDAAQFIGKIQQDSIYAVFQILNSRNEDKYVLGGVIESQSKNFRFHFLQDLLVLNYSTWVTPPDNYLEFGKQGLTAHNFSIASGQEKIALVTAAKDSILSIEFDQLQLSSLTRIVRGVMPANGRLNGNLKFSTAGKGNFNSRLRADELEILEKPFGTLTLELSHALEQYSFNLQLKDTSMLISADGTYKVTKNEPGFHVSLSLSPLNLQLLEALSFGQLKNVRGTATGKLRLTGNMEKPSIRGNITFQEAYFGSTYLKSSFSLINETISFEEKGIALNNFTIQDSRKNKAVIKGNILTTAYKEFRFNLDLTTQNFLVLNTTEEDNELYYGKVRVNAKAKITGNANRPRVDMDVSLGKGSEFTYVIPHEQKSVVEQEGIVQFVDRDAVYDPFLKGLEKTDTTLSSFTGINLTSRLELSDEETLNIVIDPIAGDKLSVKGNTSLTFDMSASGNMNLTGRYEVSEGTYELSFYKFVKRKFAIEKGGTITWSGNPLQAVLDLRASYKVETSPLDLVANELTTTDQTQVNTYRQRMPFLVYLDIDGQLLSPEIRFKLDMPPDKRGAFGGSIYAKLNDINSRESDVNKQVFALLILKRFVSDNPLESKASNLENTTRTSASRLLSDQLNKLSEKVKGLELSFDIKSYEDYSTGQAQGDTQVQLGISKSLFNDRLVVKLSGNVDVEGESTQQESVTDYIGDIALEYKLTNDGRFRITGFRTGNYDMIDGELIETGVGLIYIKDYDTFRELFRPNARTK